MKKLILTSFCFLPLFSFSQTKEEYCDVMNKFAKYYNNQQSDSIYQNILAMPFWNEMKDTYSKERIQQKQNEGGKIVSWKFAGMEGYDIKHRPMALFKVTYSKKFDGSYTRAMEFSLDEKGKIFGFNSLTKSPEIRKMLKKVK